MPVFILDDDLQFPDPGLASRDGLLAIGGDLSPERLLAAYANGIFPWFNDDEEILWWSPDPRMVLFPKEFKRSKTLRQTIRREVFEVRYDKRFEEVITHCARVKRSGEEGTWITRNMMDAYVLLHELGYAHSVETYKDGALAGGLYGISLGRAFFGESMFYLEKDASKVAFAALVEQALEMDFLFIDAQQRTEHLRSLGARPIPRNEFLMILQDALKFPTVRGKW